MKHSLMALVAAAALFGGASAQTNIPVANHGFESDTVANGISINVAPVAWSATGYVFVKNVTGTEATLECPEGVNCLELGNPSTASQSITGPFVAGHSYVVSLIAFTFKSIPSNNVGVNQPFDIDLSANGVSFLHESKTTPNGLDRSALVTTTFTMPLGAPTLNAITLKLSRNAGNQDAYFDDVSITETPYTYSNPAAARDPFGSFEVQAAGSTLPPIFPGDAEKSFATFAAANTRIMTSAAIGAAPFPTVGNQFVEATNVNTGPDFSAPVACRLEKLFVAATGAIAFDWKMLTSESIPSGTTYHDTASWTLWTVSAGLNVTSVASGQLADTNVLGPWTGSTGGYVSAMVGTFNDSTGLRTTTIPIPPANVGQPMLLSIQIQNFGDNTVPSSVLVDNYRYVVSAPLRPGTSDDLRMGTSVNEVAELSSGFGNDRKSVHGLDTLHIGVDSISMVGAPIIIAAQVFPTAGSQPAPIPAYNLWVNTGASLLVNGTTFGPFGPTVVVTPGGQLFSFLMPPGAAGNSLMLQTVVPFTGGANGIIATSEGHIIDFL